jgi:hypothetical protein
MEAVILSKDQYNELVLKIEETKTLISQSTKSPQEVFVDNQEFLLLMNVSKRTAQTWRDEGKISFSQIGSKIYYKMDDVTKMLNRNYNPALKSR